jgi:carbon-monoxide dehydrogenase large subunit
VETNKVATMPVRGAGYPEGAFAMERVLDAIARTLKLDRAEVRRRNLVPADKIPYVTPLKTRAGSPITMDSGDFPKCQQMALDALGYAGSPNGRPGRAPRGDISVSASATASKEPAAGRSKAALCGSAAPAASRSTPGPCRWVRASAPRSRKSAPSSSTCPRNR